MSQVPQKWPISADFHISLEPGRGAAFARDGPDPVASAPNQSSAPCMRRAWFRSVQATNRALDEGSLYPLLNHLLVPDEYLHRQ